MLDRAPSSIQLLNVKSKRGSDALLNHRTPTPTLDPELRNQISRVRTETRRSASLTSVASLSGHGYTKLHQTKFELRCLPCRPRSLPCSLRL